MKRFLSFTLLILSFLVIGANQTSAQHVIDVDEVFQEIFSENFVFPAEEEDQVTLPKSETNEDKELKMSQGCCKYCCKGKPCGNSCISRSYQCHKPPGCACSRC